MGISIELPNFRTIHYRHTREDFYSVGRVFRMKVTDNRTHDCQCAIELLKNSIKKAEAKGRKVKEVI
ncbi:MAG: hypothetical protein N2648_06690, partial [Aquificaceae bacterium]|nr:hypothetical protein [Aquificaceae bacterium]